MVYYLLVLRKRTHASYFLKSATKATRGEGWKKINASFLQKFMVPMNAPTVLGKLRAKYNDLKGKYAKYKSSKSATGNFVQHLPPYYDLMETFFGKNLGVCGTTFGQGGVPIASSEATLSDETGEISSISGDEGLDIAPASSGTDKPTQGRRVSTKHETVADSLKELGDSVRTVAHAISARNNQGTVETKQLERMEAVCENLERFGSCMAQTMEALLNTMQEMQKQMKPN